MRNKIDPYYQKKWHDYPLKRRLSFHLEYIGARIGYGILQFLGSTKAPKFCAFLLSSAGRYLPVTAMAKRNIARCFPDKSPDEVAQIAIGAWKNFGHVIGSYPFIQQFDTLDEAKLTLKGWDEHMVPLIEQKRPIFMFSAHIGNWELISKAAEDRGLLPHRLYKPPSNPLVYNMFRDVRVRQEHQNLLHPAGKKGLFAAFKALKQNKSLAVLVDQRMGKGMMVPFFGRPAPTNDVFAELAIKSDAVIVPCRSRYLENGQFEIIVEAPLNYDRNIEFRWQKYELLAKMNQHIEHWVRDNPDQWFWLHRRWSHED